MRRLAIALITAAVALAVGLGLATPSAGASTPPTDPPTRPAGAAADLKPVDVLQVSGLFDSVIVDAIHQAIHDSEAHGSQALILQMNTTGAVVSRDEMSDLLTAVADVAAADRHLGRSVQLGAGLRPAGAAVRRRRRHRDGARQPHRLHRRSAHLRRRAASSISARRRAEALRTAR